MSCDLIHVYFKKRIWSNYNSWIRDFGHEEAPQEVTISFIHLSIDNIWLIMEVLLISSSVAIFTQVVARVLKDNVSLRISFFYYLVVVSSLIAIIYLPQRFIIKLSSFAWLSVWHFYGNLPRPHAHAVLRWHPVANVFRSLHFHDLNSGSIGRESKIIRFMINRPEDIKVNEVALPLIIQLNMFYRIFSLWKPVILNIFCMELFGLTRQVKLILNILMGSFWQNS